MGARIVRIAVVLSAVALVLAGSGSAVRGGAAANSQSYADPQQGGLAPDITTVVVSNENGGEVHFDITLVGASTLGEGYYLGVLVDTDSDPKTGNRELAGADILVDATGHAGEPSRDYCEWEANDWKCEAAGIFADRATSATSHVMTVGFAYNNATIARTLKFFLFSSFRNTPSGQPELDIAPDSGLWSFRYLPAPDRDGDGVLGSADKCPAQNGGRFDSNKNGCPGPFETIQIDVKASAYPPSRGVTRFVKTYFEGLPAGAVVRVRLSGRRETLRANGQGRTGASRLLRGSIRVGTTVVLTATKPGYAGYWGLRRVGEGLPEVRRRCLPAQGRQVPISCARARGR